MTVEPVPTWPAAAQPSDLAVPAAGAGLAVLCGLRTPSDEELSWLSDVELRRADRYRHSTDRDRSLLGAALLRRSLAAVLDMSPPDVPVTRQCRCGSIEHGRPLVAAPAWWVSVSHGGDLIAIAVAQGRPVGIDVDAVSATAHMDLAELFQRVDKEPPSPEALTADWVRTEAAVKATGEGLTRAISDVHLHHSASTWRIRGGSSGRWVDLPVDIGHRGAIAVVGDAAFIARVAWID